MHCLNNVSSCSFRHKFLNTFKTIDIDINELFLFNYFCYFNGYSMGICFHKLWLGLTRSIKSTTSEVRIEV